MKAVILAGGLGSRLSEETSVKPKPMVEIGGKPILWDVMKMYSSHGVNDFVICLGYKGYVIKEDFANYARHRSAATYDRQRASVETHESTPGPWGVTLADRGGRSMPGGRLRRVTRYLGDEPFCFPYGEGLGDVDLQAVIDYHRREGRIATVT